MNKWQRLKYQPSTPLYAGRPRVTGSAEHIALSRKAAGEGMVLLKNEREVLPLKTGTRTAVFGKASIDYVKGGGGSGDVTVEYIRSLCEGLNMKESEGKVSLFHPLEDFYRADVRKQYEGGAVPGMTREPEVPAELVREAAAFTDTAIIAICRFSGEGWDRTASLDEKKYELSKREKDQIALSMQLFEKGDYYLTEAEAALVETVKKNFRRIIVVMNVGGMVDSTWFKNDDAIDSVLMAWQGGIEGGLAMADVLCGDVGPSGKLTDTFAQSLEVYPSTGNFHESRDYVEYTDDIYMGYRYFESSEETQAKVNYPFGFGLSYTTFEYAVKSHSIENGQYAVTVTVTNTGCRAGREVIELYIGAPQGKLGKPAKVLAAYAKTRELAPGETTQVTLTGDLAAIASYDEHGAVAEAAYVLEAGCYTFYVGTCVRSAAAVFTCELGEDLVTEQLSHRCVPGAAVEEPGLPRQDSKTLEGAEPESRYVGRHYRHRRMNDYYLIDVAKGEVDLDTFMAQLSIDDLISLLGGQPNTGVADTYGMGNLPDFGVPNMMTADGPAGLRIAPDRGVTTTAWPCATMLACTWDPELVELVGRAGAEEVKENNIGLWLTPAMNIHRSPLCGRNFEYYSEDPLVAGKTGAAMVRGIQSMHVGACPKHFAANNKETNRKASDSRLSERALREIYLKGFEIVVKESDPNAIMTSYNLINGVQASENKDLLTGILRGEWGFDGIVTTDWWTLGEHYRETKAGNDVKMGNGYPERVKEAYEAGFITKEEIYVCAKRVLEMLLKLD